jgi:hypothetical protein
LRAQALLAQQQPSEAELTELAMRGGPGHGDDT